MAHIQINGGTLVFDKRVKGIGRIKRNSGTNDPKLFAAYDSMFYNLKDQQKYDFLKALKKGTTTLGELHRYWSTHRLRDLPTVQHIIGVEAGMRKWVDSHCKNETTRKGYQWCINRLVKYNPNGTETDLPEMVKDCRKGCQNSGITRQFNMTRSVVLSYLGDQYSTQHPLYLAVKCIKTIPVGNRRGGSARTVREVIEGLSNISYHPARQVFFAMCLTGMGNSEFEGQWAVNENKVIVNGTKRASRDRQVPYWFPFIHTPRPTIDESYLRLNFRKAGLDWHIYDGRRTFAHWCEMAGVPMTRIKLYMGHKQSGDVTALYLRHKVDPYIAEDIERLQKWYRSEVVKLANVPSEFILPTEL